ncbi:hypothetical protein Turpa_4030 [Turneriella parva DSM 21527]|uniref:Uncharacterized protein n=1 Tax=Turneriella parva (strain ATCC BAA-1111 / DSM 21527 / NCTC 11395 / H) TaxID=869212 RepID=I4BBK7_TURPD|nr:hypothetical protein Turpa_4030 [Turneriella parva DSM 21527]
MKFNSKKRHKTEERVAACFDKLRGGDAQALRSMTIIVKPSPSKGDGQ